LLSLLIIFIVVIAIINLLIQQPQAMGYNTLTSLSSDLTISINMQAVTTALAVNMGMIPLNHLVNVPGDNNRLILLNDMVNAKSITPLQSNHTSTYYGICSYKS
jgi:hypothetical protein